LWIKAFGRQRASDPLRRFLAAGGRARAKHGRGDRAPACEEWLCAALRYGCEPRWSSARGGRSPGLQLLAGRRLCPARPGRRRPQTVRAVAFATQRPGVAVERICSRRKTSVGEFSAGFLPHCAGEYGAQSRTREETLRAALRKRHSWKGSRMNVAYQMRRPTPARMAVRCAAVAAGVLALLLLSLPVGRAQDRSGAVQRVKTIGFTVGDIERAANFFVNVLQFEKIADFRVVGSEYDALVGVFNSNMRIVQLKLGEQTIELTQYVSPPTGRFIPVWSNSNDAWFQHMAIVVGDMDAAYKIL